MKFINEAKIGTLKLLFNKLRRLQMLVTSLSSHGMCLTFVVFVLFDPDSFQQKTPDTDACYCRFK